jgi:benzoate/toluate 1,2-dioxygenase reductase subunit
MGAVDPRDPPDSSTPRDPGGPRNPGPPRDPGGPSAPPTTARPGAFHTRLVARRWIAGETVELDLERPAGFRFAAGQFLRLSLDERERDYSLVSGPDDAVLSLFIRRVPRGDVSHRLADAPIGHPLDFSGPRGYFTFRGGPAAAVFIATGTGIAPFVSMIRSGSAAGVILQGGRGPEDLYYGELLRQSTPRYVPCLSGPAAAGVPQAYAGRVTGYLEGELPGGVYDFYLSGAGSMIRSAVAVLDVRFPDSRVFSESYF